MKYKPKPLTIVDAVMWTGNNLAEIQTICPEAFIADPEVAPWILTIPVNVGVLLNTYVIKEPGAQGKYSTLAFDVFAALYIPQ